MNENERRAEGLNVLAAELRRYGFASASAWVHGVGEPHVGLSDADAAKLLSALPARDPLSQD